MQVWSQTAAAALKPKPHYGGADFADAHRIIPRGTSPEWGPWRTDRNPPTREIMDAICDPKIPEVYIQAASQWGKTELILNGILYFTIQDPAPQLLVREVEKSGRSFSKERIDPMIRETPALQGVFSETQKDKKNTIEFKDFAGGYLAIGNAHSMASLASRPIRVVWLDEIDGYPTKAGTGGDPVQQAIQRTQNFFNRKVVAISTPTIEGVSRINELYKSGDQRRYNTPCPRCGALQVLEWSQIIYRQGQDIRLDDIHAVCKHCEGRIEEREKAAMSAEGVWVAENPESGVRSYQISCLLSPWVKWKDLVTHWIRINATRNTLELQTFVNLKLGEVFSEATHRMADEEIYSRAQAYRVQVPRDVLCITSGVDVHDDRFEIEYLGHGEGFETWGIGYEILVGDTQQQSTWDRLLTEQLLRTFDAEDCTLKNWATAIDTQGHRTTECHAFVAANAARKIYGVYGVHGFNKPLVGKAKRSNRYRVSTYPVGVDVGKKMVYDRLRIETPGPGYCHFPSDRASGYDETYYQGLNSEELRIDIKNDIKKRYWKQIRENNHPLDCRVYAIAALEIMKPNFEDMKALRKEASITNKNQKAAKKEAAKKGKKKMPVEMLYWTEREKDLYQKLDEATREEYLGRRQSIESQEERTKRLEKAAKAREVGGRKVRGKIKKKKS